jgi:DNA-binding transcriptional ArsR family regulator
MAKTREKKSINCAGMLKVLSDDTRLSVVRLLMDGPRHVGELNDVLRIEQSLLSHHLRLLRSAGLVVAERDGKAVLYSLSLEAESVRTGRTLNLGCCKLSFEDAAREAK